jgi:hypothetical protein
LKEYRCTAFGGPMTKILKAISGEKVPYLITVLFVSVGWVITYSVDRVNNSPTVIYTTSERDSGQTRFFTVEIRNATRTVRLTNLVVSVRLEGKDSHSIIQHVAIEPMPPAWNGNQAPSGASGDMADFPIEYLQPGWCFQLITQFSGADVPKVYLTKSPDPVRFVEPTIETWFLRHEMTILIAMLGVYTGLIVLIIVYTFRTP